MLLCCDRAVCTCSLYRRANVPDYIRATLQSACTEYASGRGGHVLCGCCICVFFVSDEWTILWCPVTSATVHITGRFPAMWRTMGNTLVMLLRNTMLNVTWTRSSEAMCRTWPRNWTLLVFGLLFIQYSVSSLKIETWNSWGRLNSEVKVRCEENLQKNKIFQHTLLYLHFTWLPPKYNTL